MLSNWLTFFKIIYNQLRSISYFQAIIWLTFVKKNCQSISSSRVTLIIPIIAFHFKQEAVWGRRFHENLFISFSVILLAEPSPHLKTIARKFPDSSLHPVRPILNTGKQTNEKESMSSWPYSFGGGNEEQSNTQAEIRFVTTLWNLKIGAAMSFFQRIPISIRCVFSFRQQWNEMPRGINVF